MNRALKTLTALIACISIAIIGAGLLSSFLITSDTSSKTQVLSVGEKFFGGLKGTYDHIALSDIYIPEGINRSVFGLKVYDGSSWHDSEVEEGNPFDYSKPTVIYTHGMGTGNGIDRPDQWYLLGYNVCHFLWGPFADDMPTAGQDKVWGKGTYSNQNNILTWRDSPWSSSPITYKEDVPNFSITEIYATYYLDLMEKAPYTGSEIRFYGHSLGAHLSLALTNFLIFSVENGSVSPEYLPDRVSLLDPYVADFTSPINCSWSQEPMSSGSARKFYETSIKARKMGIAIEELRTSEFVGIAGSLNGTTYYQDFKDNIMFTRVSTGFFLSVYPDLVTAIGMMHVIAEIWYAEMLTLPIVYEESYNSMGISPLLSKEYIYARMGQSYELDFQNSVDTLLDDTVSSSIETATISGFIYEDANCNKVFDERVNKQLSGVTVSLMDENGVEIVSLATEDCGYYSFQVEADKNYCIRVKSSNGYSSASYTETALKAIDEKDLIINNIPLTRQG